MVLGLEGFTSDDISHEVEHTRALSRRQQSIGRQDFANGSPDNGPPVNGSRDNRSGQRSVTGVRSSRTKPEGMSVEPISTPLSESPIKAPEVRLPSLVLVNTGNGKGKSTAAFGTMLRAVARGWNVAVVQFLKSGTWKVGEEKIGRQLGVDWWALGDGFSWDSENLTESEAIAREAWRCAKAHIESGSYQLVILDEITYPMNWGWFSTEEVVRSIENRPPTVNVICTGRDAPAPLMAIAHTVTEMLEVKHAYASGIAAKKGIDF